MRQCQRLTIWSGCPAQAKEKTGRGDPLLTIFVRGPTDVDGNAVPDPHFADILGNAFKKLSEQSIKEIYAKDKSGKKVSTDDDKADADLRKELASTKKQLEKANNKLASFGRQHGRKEDLSCARARRTTRTSPPNPRTRTRRPPPREPRNEAPSGKPSLAATQPRASLVPCQRLSVRRPASARLFAPMSGAQW